MDLEQLHLLQQLFISYIHDNHGNHQQIIDLCIEPKRGNILQRLDIYSNNYIASLLSILKKRYPVCLQLVGEDFFVSMSHIFIKQTPSTCIGLDDYGEQFASFIDHYPPANCLPYLADVARLEWAWAQAYFGPDVGPVDYAKFASLQLKMAYHLVFDLPANTTFLQSQYAIDQIWQLHQNNLDEESFINLEHKQVHLIIWRRKWEVLIEHCTAEEWEVLIGFHNKMSLSEVCEHIVEMDIDINAVLPGVISKGWVRDFHYQ